MFDRRKPYNDLPVLPPKTDVCNNLNILKKLVTASRILGTLNGNLNRLPNPLMLVNTLSLQEAKTSTEIENIFTTEDELYKAISDKKKGESSNPATKEVLRYREALWAGYQSLRANPHIDKELIIQIYNKIKDTTIGYRPPQANIVIKRGQSELKPGEIVYTPPRGEDVIEKLMDNLIVFLNDDTKYPIDPLIKMCIAHYQFEAIHPFQDGNGRTGRVLNLLYLVSKNLLSQPILYISKYIIQKKEDYYYKLNTVTQRGSWEEWILFMLDAVEKTSSVTNEKINDIITQMDETLNYAKSKVKWYTKEINEAVFSQPYIKPKIIGQIVNRKSRTTLTKYMNELVENKILRAQRIRGEVYYLNDDLIRILES